MFEYQLNMAETVGFAIILLLLGRWIKKKVNFFEKFFIPAPVIGGTLFSIILLIGHQTETFTFTFNDDIKNLLMIAFFTTVGFSASLKSRKSVIEAVGKMLNRKEWKKLEKMSEDFKKYNPSDVLKREIERLVGK